MNHKRRLRKLEEELPLNRLRMRLATAGDIESSPRKPESISETSAKHARVVSELIAAVIGCIPEVSAMAPGRNKIAAIRALSDASDKLGRLDRLIHGISEGEASVRDERDDDGTVRIIRTTVPAPMGASVSDLLRDN